MQRSSLSTGAKASIGVVVTFASILVIVAVVFVYLRKQSLAKLVPRIEEDVELKRDQRWEERQELYAPNLHPTELYAPKLSGNRAPWVRTYTI